MDQALGLASENGGLNFTLSYTNSENSGRLLNFSEPQFIYKMKEIIIMVAQD